MNLVKYILRRSLVALPVLFGILTLNFILTRLMPGDPILGYLAQTGISDPETYMEQYEYMRINLGLDDPLLMQYGRYIKDIVSGNWGFSAFINEGMDVWTMVMLRLPRTIDIALFSILIAGFVGIKTGVISAAHRNKAKDVIVRTFSIVGVSIPIFYMGMLLQYLFGFQLRWFPATGYKSYRYGDPTFVTGFRMIDALLSGDFYVIADYLHHLFLPVLCLSFVTLASISRQTRSSMLEVLDQDYIRTARAKGAYEKDVIRTHALKNALIPTTTVMGLNLAGLLGGAVLAEITFGIKGIGKLFIDAILQSDYWVANAILFIVSVFYLLVSLIIDIAYTILDPRIMY
ncbi:MAG: ABC transporter permease [Promethearchaeota archaeon]|jgi:peptide/nickel transport system permease protein